MSTKILAQRSALPAVYSRPSKQTAFTKLTHEEKGRLLRIAKRKVKGPFNSYVDPMEAGSGSAILEPSKAVKASGKYDVWTATRDPSATLLKAKRKFTDPEDFLVPYVTKPDVKVCCIITAQDTVPHRISCSHHRAIP
jgi:nucleolar protein 53